MRRRALGMDKSTHDALIALLPRLRRFAYGLSGSVDEGDAQAQDLVNQREKARKSKNWPEADRLRQELTAKNIVVEDTPQGARWWKKN